jgi:hypothetical protein
MKRDDSTATKLMKELASLAGLAGSGQMAPHLHIISIDLDKLVIIK